jgi:hypothetical protein
MKKTTLLLLTFFTLMTLAKAQIQKGTYTMSPNVYFSHSSASKINDFSISANYGRCIGNQFLLSGGLSSSWLEDSFWKNYSANLSLQYYYFPESKLNPYISTGFDYSKFTFLSNLTSFGNGTTLGSGRNVTNGVIFSNPGIDTTFHKFFFQQFDASIGTGVQYFINENIALDAHLNFTAFGVTQKNVKTLMQQEYTVRLKPFYTSSSYKSAKEIKDFYYRGKTQILGSLSYYPKTIGATVGHSSFYINGGATYSLNKFFAAGASFFYAKSNIYTQLNVGLNAESNVKLYKRLYLSPNLNYSFSKIDKYLGISSINANLNLKFFVNKNIAWTANLLSVPLYKTNKTNSQSETVYFRNGFTYFLK